MLKNLLTILPLSFILFSCTNNIGHFSVLDSGLKYKVLQKSESKAPINMGDFIELKLKYKTKTDSILFNSEEFGGSVKMQVANNSHLGGCFEEALSIMNPGDKYQFVISADSFYLKTKKEILPEGVKTNSNLIFEIQIIRKINSKEIAKEKALLEEKMKEQEHIILQQYIKDKEIKQPPTESGLYYIETKAGYGKKAKSGDVLIVHYTGKLINGDIFDSSYNRNEAFAFKLGAGEVIPGWEEGFSSMKKGGKAVFIIPSKLAYSKEGFSTIIPPYSSLIFEVELIDIKNNK